MGSLNRYGYETNRQSGSAGQGNAEKFDTSGGCDNMNINQPYCARYPEECRSFFEQCMKLANGTGCEFFILKSFKIRLENLFFFRKIPEGPKLGKKSLNYFFLLLTT